MNRAGFQKMRAAHGGTPLRSALEEAQRAALQATGGGRNKYGAKRCEVDGLSFDSKLEARRWLQLKDWQRRGLISGLIRQVEYKLEVGGILICRYRADFVYVDQAGREIVEDVKAKSGATITPAYRIKKALMRACHGITITEYLA